MINLSGHFYLLIHTLLYGAYLALTFDFLQILCKKMTKSWLQPTLTGLFWGLQIPLILLYFYQVNYGVFQSYLLIFIFLGAFFYTTFLKVIFFKHLREVAHFSFHVYRALRKLLDVFIFKPMTFVTNAFFPTVEKDETSTK